MSQCCGILKADLVRGQDLGRIDVEQTQVQQVDNGNDVPIVHIMGTPVLVSMCLNGVAPEHIHGAQLPEWHPHKGSLMDC